MKIIAGFILALVLIGGGYGFYTSSKEKAAIEQIDRLTARWADAAQLAASTSRISLSGPVKDMQQIVRELEAVEPWTCTKGVKTALLAGMRAEIDVYMTFMRLGDSEPVLEPIRHARDDQRLAAERLAGCR
ncbi:hypothetical protein [Pseudothauera rhizosphaerae]|uniref:Uncharacterized protein n=1 Tax=Pseudothauera rhizosphaerae TaxID=2565932 RepID=A0A4V3WAX0_9RHOO|nr:hypothetical protein [Pseudothauera rhizosphaerae]THF60927.1 hypothetical protein E6O51_11910 [Pseudothauera rhizosphaerae]